MFGLETSELIIVLCILLLIFGANRLRDLFKGGGPFDGAKTGFEFQPINAPVSVVAHCPKCGAATKGFYENCPVCGEKIGETFAVTKTI